MIKSTRLSGLMILTVFLLTALAMTNASWAATARVAATGNHTVALKADGTLWGWGDNSFGQIGDGSLLSRNVPVRIGADSEWATVVAGFYHTVALKTDGSLWTWGDNTKGQLGDSLSSASRSLPARIGTGTNWTAIAAGDFHTLALKADGTLWAWGDNGSGQAGTGSVVPGIQTSPVQIGSGTDWAAIAAGGTHSLARKANNTLWGWGSNAAGQLGNGAMVDANAPVQIVLPPPFNNTDWSVVSAGQVHAAALKANGSLWSWGSNTFGQLGNRTTVNSAVPVRETGNATNWSAVSAGDSHSVARKSNNTLWAWGGNSHGQLGIGTNLDVPGPLQVGVNTDWTGAAAGSMHTVAMKANGTVWCWGDNTFGQLGDGTNVSKNAPAQPVVFQVTPGPAPATGVTVTPNQPSPHTAATAVIFTATGQGSANYDYRFWLFNGTSWTVVQDYSNGTAWTMPASTPVGSYVVAVDVRTDPAVYRDAVAYLSYEVIQGPASGVEIAPSQPSPHTQGTAVNFVASGQGSANYDYRFQLFDSTNWTLVQDYGNGAVWTMPASTPAGSYVVAVDVRTSSAVYRDAVAYLSYEVTQGPASGVIVTPSQPSPHPPGTSVDFIASGQGSTNYDYRFWLFDGTNWAQVQDYGNGATWNMPATTAAGDYVIGVDVRTSSTVYRDAVTYLPYSVQ